MIGDLLVSASLKVAGSAAKAVGKGAAKVAGNVAKTAGKSALKAAGKASAKLAGEVASQVAPIVVPVVASATVGVVSSGVSTIYNGIGKLLPEKKEKTIEEKDRMLELLKTPNGKRVSNLTGADENSFYLQETVNYLKLLDNINAGYFEYRKKELMKI